MGGVPGKEYVDEVLTLRGVEFRDCRVGTVVCRVDGVTRRGGRDLQDFTEAVIRGVCSRMPLSEFQRRLTELSGVVLNLVGENVSGVVLRRAEACKVVRPHCFGEPSRFITSRSA